MIMVMQLGPSPLSKIIIVNPKKLPTIIHDFIRKRTLKNNGVKPSKNPKNLNYVSMTSSKRPY